MAAGRLTCRTILLDSFRHSCATLVFGSSLAFHLCLLAHSCRLEPLLHPCPHLKRRQAGGAPCGAAVSSPGSGLQEADPESSRTGGNGREKLAEAGGEPGGGPATLSQPQSYATRWLSEMSQDGTGWPGLWYPTSQSLQWASLRIVSKATIYPHLHA